MHGLPEYKFSQPLEKKNDLVRNYNTSSQTQVTIGIYQVLGNKRPPPRPHGGRATAVKQVVPEENVGGLYTSIRFQRRSMLSERGCLIVPFLWGRVEAGRVARGLLDLRNDPCHLFAAHATYYPRESY